MKKAASILLCALILFTCFGCKQGTETVPQNSNDVHEETNENATEEYEVIHIKELNSFYTLSELLPYLAIPDIYNNESADEAFRRYREFAIKCFYHSLSKNENDIISPLSLYYALAILANAAEGHTKEEMETVLGMTIEDLNLFLSELDSLYPTPETAAFNKANALWFNTNLGELKQEYIKTINTYYGNSINEGSFSDKQKIVRDVNDWSFENTYGAINDLVNEDDIKNDTIFLILNALTAGGLWVFPFESSATFYQEFNCYDKSHTLVEMMHQTLFGYWSDGRSEGFTKELWNGTYFVGIVPNRGVDVYDYLNLMDSDTFLNYKNNARYEDVVGSFKPDFDWDGECPIVDQHYTNLSFPKFSYEKEYDLEKTLKKIGLKNIFDFSTCDFSKMADGPLYVQQVKQKCKVEVDEEKAIAAAVTMISGGRGGGDCLEVRDKIYHDVVFDRPFLFAFVDREAKNIMFMGVVNQIGDPIEKVIQIENITGKINIRSIPSTQGEKNGFFEKGQKIYAFETREAEGYTWYRIGVNKWVADKDGEWIRVLNN